MKKDVIVIGAGAAGIHAAIQLKNHGFNVLILEARERTGGRIQTLAKTIAIELGAEFIHGAPQITLDLFSSAQIPYYDVSHLPYYFDGRNLKSIANLWTTLSEVFGSIRHTQIDRPFIEFLRTSHRLPKWKKDLAQSFVEGFHAGLSQKISSNELAEMRDFFTDPEQMKIARPLYGYQALIQYLESSLKKEIHLNTVVQAVKWKPKAVQVEAFNRKLKKQVSYRADCALITLPIGVLKSRNSTLGAVRFDPSLPWKKMALEGIEAGHIVKLVLQFQQAFWDRKEYCKFSFIHAPNLTFFTWWSVFPIHYPVLTAWTGGNQALKLTQLPQNKITHLAIKDLATIFKIRSSYLQKNLVNVSYHNWSADPFSRGAYSYILSGGKNSQKKLAQPIHQTLYFAGEATHQERIGTVDGALLSGVRAASEIMRDHK